MRRKLAVISLFMILFIETIAITQLKPTSASGVGTSPFVFRFRDGLVVTADQYLVEWYWFSSDQNFLGFRFIDQDGNLLFTYGFDGNEYNTGNDLVPKSFTIDFTNITTQRKTKTFCIYYEMAIDIIDYYNSFLRITWRPSIMSSRIIELPIYMYFVVIGLGFVGFGLYFYKYYMSCENPANRRKLKCRSQWKEVLEEEEMSEEEKKYRIEKKIAKEYLFKGE